MTNPHQLAVLLYGAGGHAAVVEAAVLQGNDYYVAGIFDDVKPPGMRLVHASVQGARAALMPYLKEGICRVHVGIGDNASRQRIAAELEVLGCQLVTIVHPGAWVEPGARVGPGSFVAARAVVGTRASLGKGVIVNTGATVDHDCLIGDFAHVCPGAHLAGNIRVGSQTLIGTGAAVIPEVTIGAHAIVGAGAVVIRDVPDGVVVAGNPARVLRKNEMT